VFSPERVGRLREGAPRSLLRFSRFAVATTGSNARIAADLVIEIEVRRRDRPGIAETRQRVTRRRRYELLDQRLGCLGITLPRESVEHEMGVLARFTGFWAAAPSRPCT
jgi:hypothetical protein